MSFDVEKAIAGYALFLGSLDRTRISRMPEIIAPDVEFSDPFNRVNGLAAMQHIFEDMYETLGEVRFDIHHHAATGRSGFLQWHFHSVLRGQPWSFEGVTYVEFDEKGLVSRHADQWDAAREFYEHFPVIGWVLGTIRRKLSLKS
tara:strand:+ start:312599 stop:313033 length:435 start_codon:yes stop_codon:yes gene_type:complete